ncbi:MAG TPA: S8 family serine peptidase [Gaiellaceae bacterium]|nr:S8 family serine peptidase [Gaiellaceae bacterium]
MSRRIVLLLALLACANLLLLAVAQAASGTDAPGTIVAVVDSGVSPHPSLDGRLLDALDLVRPGGTARDTSGHGTAVAALVAEGCPRCSILPVRVLDGNRAAPWARIADGIVAAVEAGARVVNVSIAGPGGSPELRAAIEHAAAHDVLVVAAAGNTGSAVREFPAAYPQVVAVAATDGAGTLHDWSARGAWADVRAAGCAAVPVGNASAWACGTSFAAPRVTAAAALARGAAPAASAVEIAAALPRTLPAEVAAPRIEVRGLPRPGATVHASAAGVEPGLGAAIRWFRCDGAACRPVGGATYRVSAADAGATLVARVVTKPFGGLWLAASEPLPVAARG